MRSFKNLLLIILALTVFVLVFSGCSGSDAQNDVRLNPQTFAVIMLDASSESAENMKNGIYDKLVDACYSKENIDIKDAKSNKAELKSICSNVAAGSYDAVFTIGTEATKAFVDTGSKIPCFFCGVSNPVEEGIISDFKAPDKNATGVATNAPVEDTIDMGLKITPTVTKWGVIYCKGSADSIKYAEAAEKYFDVLNTDCVLAKVEGSGEISEKTKKLLKEKCNAVLVINDEVIQKGARNIADICNDKGVPTYGNAPALINEGCLAAMYVDEYSLGERAASKCMNYLSSKPINQIPTVEQGIDNCIFNYKSYNKIKDEKEKFDVIPPSEYTFEENLNFVE